MPKHNKVKKRFKKGTLIIILLLIVLSGSFVFWANNTYEPSVEAMNAMNDDEKVDVTSSEYIVFKPEGENLTKGFIFYPGGKVEPESYATLCRGIAEEGYLVVIAPMTMDLAILSPDRATDIINIFDEIETWVIGGHSLGGVMAAKYASEHDERKGLALYAAYPQGNELEDLDIDAVSIYGSEDGVADIEKIKNAILPKNSKIIEIKGGNHSNFGSYGDQSGDNKGDISEEEQINEAIKYTTDLLKDL